jgi:hypothetical protein
VARRDAQPDLSGQLGDGQPAVLLERSKNLPINRIHLEYSSTYNGLRKKTWKHIPAVRG